MKSQADIRRAALERRRAMDSLERCHCGTGDPVDDCTKRSISPRKIRSLATCRFVTRSIHRGSSIAHGKCKSAFSFRSWQKTLGFVFVKLTGKPGSNAIISGFSSRSAARLPLRIPRHRHRSAGCFRQALPENRHGRRLLRSLFFQAQKRVPLPSYETDRCRICMPGSSENRSKSLGYTTFFCRDRKRPLRLLITVALDISRTDPGFEFKRLKTISQPNISLQSVQSCRASLRRQLLHDARQNSVNCIT